MDKIKEDFQIVVARYNEDIKWLLPFKDITIIYNKGDYHPLLSKFHTIYLNNVGRESHTYLYHIINNYNNLKKITIFFQGNISDHNDKILDIEDYFQDKDFIGKLDNYDINLLKKEINHFGKYKKDLKTGNMRKSDFLPFDWINNIIGIDLNNISNFSKVVWNANFSIKKELILKKSINFYKNILRYISDHSNPEEGHFLERSWYIIFNNKYIEKSLINYIKINNYNNINNIYNFLKKKSEQNNKELHLWIPIYSNIDFPNKIYCLNSINKFIKIYPLIENNSFIINIKSSSDVSILIELENIELEILLGAWNNKKSILKDNTNNKIINTYDNEIFDINNYIKFEIIINNDIIIKKNNNNIINVLKYINDNNEKNNNIKNIYIKNNLKNNDIYLDYILNKNQDINIKTFIYNPQDNIEKYYKTNFSNNYINEIYFEDLL